MSLDTNDNMKYTESKKYKPFNWYDALDKAEKTQLTLREELILLDKASRWPNCACGQLDIRIERDEDGRPMDFILRELGLDFAQHVEDSEYAKAKSILKQIEKREQELLNEQ